VAAILGGVNSKPRLLLIDGHSVAYRAFFALPVDNFSTTTGQHTNAVFGFTSMFINVLRDEKPTHVAVAFDVSRHSFRTDSYPEYKATRSTSPEEFKGQVTLIKDVLDALNVPHVELEGYEADDVIATLTTQAAADGFDVLRQIRAARPSLPVVVMSGRFGIDPFSKAMMAMLIKLGAACTLVKPARCADILSALRCAISLRPEDQT